MKEFLSTKALEVLRDDDLWPEDPQGIELRKELGVDVQKLCTLVAKDFCIVCMLNFYQDYWKAKHPEAKNIPDEVFDELTDFAEYLEYAMGVCAGRAEYETDGE